MAIEYDFADDWQLRFGISYGEPAEYHIYDNFSLRSGVWLKLGFRVIVK